MIEAVRTSITPVYFNGATWRYIHEGCHPHYRRRENLKSHFFRGNYRNLLPFDWFPVHIIPSLLHTRVTAPWSVTALTEWAARCLTLGPKLRCSLSPVTWLVPDQEDLEIFSSWTMPSIFFRSCIYMWSRVSSDSIVSDYGLDDRAIGVRSPAGAKDFSSSLCVPIGSGAHTASCTMGTGGPFPGGKARLGRDADNSPPSCAEVVNE
jgi:hypothetical protein